MPALPLETTRRPGRATFLRPRIPQPAPQPTPAAPREATHDFLVPNPRPDLTMDAATLRMLARD